MAMTPLVEREEKAASAAWRPLRPADLVEVTRIAERLHPDFPERPEVFAQKAAMFPAGCFALESQGSVIGYALSHPWSLDDIPPLDSFLKALPESPDCLHLHDIAILDSGRGRGAARTVEALLMERARQRNLRKMTLVSLCGSDGLWRRLGYRPRSSVTLDQLRSYGRGALYMARDVLPA
jgi:ribosomal protein S18 acetylase RimI-like enzyme